MQGRLEDIVFVGIDRALHDALTKAVGAAEHYHVGEAALRVEREHHSSRAKVGTDHLLDAD